MILNRRGPRSLRPSRSSGSFPNRTSAERWRKPKRRLAERSRCSKEPPNSPNSLNSQTPKSRVPSRLLHSLDTQNPIPESREESDTPSRKIRDLPFFAVLGRSDNPLRVGTHVLVHMEEIGWVVFLLQRKQSVVVLSESFSHPLFTLIPEIVHIRGSLVEGLQCIPAIAHPAEILVGVRRIIPSCKRTAIVVVEPVGERRIARTNSARRS